MTDSPRRGLHWAPAWELNFNSLLQIASLVILIVAGVSALNNKSRDISDLQVWRSNVVDTSLTDLDDRVNAAETQILRLADRATAIESRNTEMLQALRESQQQQAAIVEKLSQQAADLKVILAFVDEQRQRQRSTAK